MASPVAGTSIGRTVYQELLEFTWLDLAKGGSNMAKRTPKWVKSVERIVGK